VKRAGWYSQAVEENGAQRHLMRLLDEPYTRGPLSGVLRMTAWWPQPGAAVKAKRVRRWWRQLG
jgi:hypothetical protein